MGKKGLLLINLGSPDGPDTRSVRRYLIEFLTDRYVVDLHWVFRQALVRGIIAPFRAPKSAEAYSQIWGPEGSPLVSITRDFAAKVAAHLDDSWSVRWGMRYGQPSLYQTLKDWNVDEIFVVPLYPQYAESSTRTAVEEVARSCRQLSLKVSLQVLEQFCDRREFTLPLAQKIQRQIESFQPDHLLLSFHGLPEHHLQKLHPEHCLRTSSCCDQWNRENTSCYRAQCFVTSRAIMGALKFSQTSISVSFQSRLGRRPWIQPFTDHRVEQLAASGAKRLLVSCPSFVADCLETLEEIQIRLRESFRSQGGEDLQLVSALNAEDKWVDSFCSMIRSSDLNWKNYLKL